MIITLLSAFALGAQHGVAPLAKLKPITHLKTFFDERALGPGQAVFLSPPNLTPSLHPFEPPAPMLRPSLALLPDRFAYRRGAGPKGVAASPKAAADPFVGYALAPYSVLHALEEYAAMKPFQGGARGSLNSAAHPLTAVAAAFAHRAQPNRVKAVVPNHLADETPSLSASSEDVEDKIVSINFVNVPLRTVANALMVQANTNMLLLGGTDTAISIHAHNRKFIDVLRDLCAISHLDFLKVDKEFVIAPADALKAAYPDAYSAAHPAPPAPAPVEAPPIVTRVYRTNYVDANKLIASLQTQADLTAGLAFIPNAPEEVPELSTTDTTSVGATGSVLTKDQNAAKISRALIIRGPKAKVDEAYDLCQALDLAPRQVRIDVTIDDVSGSLDKNFGIEWPSSISSAFNEGQPSGIGFGKFTRSPLSINATLQMLQDEGKAKVLANPSIAVLDGQRAYLLVGQRLTFPILQQLSQASTPIYTTQEERVGIYLQVGVWVTNDGKVSLQLYPQVSTVTGFINVNGGQYPQVGTREAQTVLSVESGKTIVLGGLINNQDTVDVQKVPILGDIPIIGEFFKRTHRTRTNDQVIITITPTILKD